MDNIGAPPGGGGRCGIAAAGVNPRPTANLFTLRSSLFSLPPGSRIPFGDLRSPTSLVRGRLPSLYWLMLLSLNSWPLQVPFPHAAGGMGRADVGIGPYWQGSQGPPHQRCGRRDGKPVPYYPLRHGFAVPPLPKGEARSAAPVWRAVGLCILHIFYCQAGKNMV